MDKVDVLIATYQGDNYLEELIESILHQTYPNIHIFIRDDGSKDSTVSILQKYTEAFPDKITLISDSKPNLGVISNFSELIHQSKAPYVFLSDQDDKWLPNKIEKSMHLMKSMEKQYGANTPLMVHTDLIVADRELKEIHPSFWAYTKLNSKNNTTNRLLVQNYIAGCTMGMNLVLVEMLHPIPKDVMMHDWWIALVASCFGHIGHLNESTILYRQHGNNTLGAQKFKWHKVFTVFFKSISLIGDRPRVQAMRLLECYNDHLREDQKEMLQAFIGIKEKSFVQQRIEVLKYGFYKHGFLRNIRTILRPFKY